MKSLMEKKASDLEEWLTRGGARADGDSNSARGDEDELHTGGGLRSVGVVKAKGEFSCGCKSAII